MTKFSTSGNSLHYSSFIGGNSIDEGWGIVVDGFGSAYIGGRTWSSNFPTANTTDSILNGLYDVFVMKLSTSGNSLLYSTYLGGSANDHCNGIALDASGSTYVTGVTYSANFPTASPYDASLDGFFDLFAAKLSHNSCGVGFTGNVDCDPDDVGDISDLTLLIDHLFVRHQPLCCVAEANIDGSLDGIADISDLTRFIDHLFISNNETTPCQ